MRHRFVRSPPIFNPANLSLNGWWRGSFSASPWVGTTSAGTSSANNLTEATNPPSPGSSLAGKTAANFDGTNDILTGAALSTYLSTSSFTLAMLFSVDAAGADSTAGAGEILSDTTGGLSVGTYPFSGSQFKLLMQYQTASGWQGPSAITLDYAAWHLVVFGYLGGSACYTSVNGGAVAITAGYSAPNTLGGTLRVGASKASFGRFFNGQIQDLMLTPSALTAANHAGLAQYATYYYQLQLGT